MTNELFIKELVNKFPNLNELKIENHQLVYNNERIDLEQIHLETFIRQNTYLYNNLKYLDSEMVFKIIYYHCNYFKTKNIKINLDENIVIKGLRAISKADSNGLVNNYLYLIDDLSNTYLVPCYYANDVFNYYQSNKNITVYNLNEFLKQYKTFNFKENLDNGLVNWEYVKMMINLDEVKPYLVGDLKDELEKFLDLIKEIELKENRNSIEEELIKAIPKRKELERSLKKESGYLNDLLIIGFVIFLGIILSILLIKNR